MGKQSYTIVPLKSPIFKEPAYKYTNAKQWGVPSESSLASSYGYFSQHNLELPRAFQQCKPRKYNRTS